MGTFINKNDLTDLTMIETVKVSSKGQIVIPEDIRKSLNIREGTKLVMIENGNKIVIELEKDFINNLDKLNLDKDKLGWLLLAEKGLAKIWDNPKDDETWGKYL